MLLSNNRDYTYNIKETEYPIGPDKNITPTEIHDYMHSLALMAHGEPLEIRSYQVDGVYQALYNKNAILLAATGSGKSCILYTVSRYITEKLGGRILIIVPTVGLTTQLRADFADYSTANGYDVESNVHLIQAGVDKNTDKPIVISTFQSLKGVSAKYLNQFSCIFTDEGHKIQAESFKTIYGNATEVPYRLACTGTLHDAKCHILAMESLTGPVHKIAVAQDLIANKQLVPLNVSAITIQYPVEVCKPMSKVDYDTEIGWLITNPRRNNFIAKLATTCKGTTLVFFRFEDHGKVLYDKIKELVGDSRKVFFISGKVSREERETIRKAANDGDAMIICSMGTMSAGVNIPAVENIVNGHPVKSKITFLQSIGRGLRLKEGKTHCNLFDIGDSLAYKTKVNTTFKHFGERLNLLISEGHTFKRVTVQF